MKIFIAGSSKEIQIVSGFMQKIRDLGHEITYDWTNTVRLNGGAEKANDCSADVLRSLELCFDNLHKGVIGADLFWMIVPDSETIGGWVEYGYTSQTDIPIIISGNWKRTIYNTLAEKRFDTHDEALSYIKSRFRSAPPRRRSTRRCV